MFWWWDSKYWLPRGVTWEAMTNKTAPIGSIYPNFHDLSYLLITGVALIVYRLVFENYIFVPAAYFLSRKNPPETRQEMLDREKKYSRMAECAMRCLYYLISFSSGLYLVSHESHLYDITECWKNWPFHPIPKPIAWFYYIQGGFYISLIFGILFLDAKRSDFYQMLTHHFITLLLIGTSWTMNMVRVGTLILVSHDAVDILIDLAKLFRYEQMETCLSITFAGVLLVWVLTRLVYFPFVVIRSVWFDAPALIQEDYVWMNFGQQPMAPRFIMILLTALLVLHIFWCYILFKIAYDSINEGVLDDLREDFDEVSKCNREKAQENSRKNKDD
ncbi:unnamed protein product [Caenorhabditis angaria]|uniref:TLC domain-containing protein n=1 Tax=Caenorhabditis angaria TaxID=860376 RepID=A0A9P1J0R7_9PELO|nr:unnamed protein product [Caenorhabditis angaria]